MTSNLTFKQLFPLAKLDFKTNNTPALFGEPGIGKSSFLEGLARELKTAVFTLPVNQLADRADLTGARVLEREHNGQKEWEQAFFPHATIMEAIRYAKDHPDENPILFLDEINRASADITSSILAFITLRRIGTLDFPPNLLFAIAGNDKGNVVSLDGASLSRFSIYRVSPDLETFLSVQEVNPFIEEVLTQNPDLLMCDPLSVVTSQADDDDKDQTDDNWLLGFDASSADFSQITRPRTISLLSRWMNEAKLDKSGSDEELEMLKNMFSMTTHNEDGSASDLMMAAIEAKVGFTDFALKLHDSLQNYYTNIISSASSSRNGSARSIVGSVRPDQSVINDLSRAADSQRVEEIVNTLSEEQKANAMIWLFDNQSIRELNNNDAAVNLINQVVQEVTTFSPQQAKVFNNLLASADSINQPMLNIFKNSQTPLSTLWSPVITMILGD